MKTFISLILIFTALAAHSQKVTNTWNGSHNYYWHNANNWSRGHIPTSTEDVVIPNGMPRYPSVDFYDEEIKSLIIYSNAEVRVYDQTLDVSGDVDVHGELQLLHEDAQITCDNLTWKSGSSAQSTDGCAFRVYGNWEFASGANVQLDHGFASFYGNENQYIRSKDADCYMNDVWVAKGGGVLGLSGQSSATCQINGDFTLAGSNYDLVSYSAQTIQIGKYLSNTDSSIEIAIENGSIEFTGISTSYFRPQPGDYINNLIVNTGNLDMDLSTLFATSTEIKGDVTINSGRFDVTSMHLIVGGDWDNNVGSVGFWERDQKVTFNGSGHQYCSNEKFYTLEINKPSGALRMNGSDVECEEYDWTDGAIDVLSGSFTANELLDAGIAGEWYVNDEVHIHQNVGYIDLLGDLHIYDGGYMHVYGGSDDSWWPYSPSGSHFEIESGGALKFHDVGINIRPSGTLTTNITGGWIGMAGDFKIDRADFYAPLAVWAMQGLTDTEVKIIQGQISQLDIDKLTGKASGENLNMNIPDSAMQSAFGYDTKKYSDNKYVSTGIYTTGFTGRDGKVHNPTRANTVSVASTFSSQKLGIYGGTFNLNGHTANISGDMFVLDGGILKMINLLDVLNVKNIEWHSGSADLITKGEINVSGNWTFKTGTEAHLGSDNIVRFIGGGFSSIDNYDEDAFFGSVRLQKNTGSSVYLHELSTYPIHCDGDFSIQNNNNFYPQTETLIVDGTLDIQYGSAIYLEDAGGQLINNSNLDLTGKIEVDGGEAIIHGTFDISSTGNLTIDGGSFEFDSHEECEIHGQLNLSDGIFSAKTLSIESSSDVNISGGTIIGRSIIALFPNTFQPSGGVFISQAESGYPFFALEQTNFFHDLEIDAITGLGSYASTNLQINHDLNISSGNFYVEDHHIVTVDNNVTIYGGLKSNNTNSKLIFGNDITWKSGSTADEFTDGEIHVYGNWVFENGTNAQLGENSVVKFVGDGASSIYNYDSDAEFGHILAYKSPGINVYLNGLSTYPIRCAGGASVENGCQLRVQHEDLICDGGLYVGINAYMDVYASGSVVCGGNLDIWGELDVDDAEMTVGGTFALQSSGTLSITGGSLVCNRPTANIIFPIKGNFNLTGSGLFEITNNNIEFFSLVSTNITDGTIRIGGHFFATQPGCFEPNGGRVEMSDGISGGEIICINGNYFYDLEITDHIFVSDDFMVNHDLDITSGLLNINAHTVEVGHDVNIWGTLTMTNPSGVLECANSIYWMPGSDDNITAGHIYSDFWTFEDGTNAKLGTGNTVHLSSGNSPFDPDAEFGNLVIGAWSKSGSGMDNSTDLRNFGEGSGIEGLSPAAPTDGKTVYPRRVAGNCTTLTGFGWYSPMDIIVQGTLDIQDGGHQTLTMDNTIYNYSGFTLNGLLDLQDEGNGYVDGEFEIASTGELIIEGGEFIVENGPPTGNKIFGSLTMTDGLLQSDAGLYIESTASTNISGGMIRATGFVAETAGTFEPLGGLVEIQTHNNGHGWVKVSNGNYLCNLNVNPGGNLGGATLKSNLLVTHDLNILLGGFWFDSYTATVQGNTTIHNGYLRMIDATDVLNTGDDLNDEIIWKSEASMEWNDMGRINIFGNCTIENGVAENIEADHTLAFVGTGDQQFNNMDDATFGTIELDKPSGELIIPTGSSVECQNYEWTSGTFSLEGGNFTANDIADDGLFGTYNFNSGEAYFIQDEEQEANINANINIHGAEVTVQGSDHISGWANEQDITINMSNGVFSFIDIGIGVSAGVYNLTENISGGTIRTNRSFYCFSPDFTPSGGNVELFGNYTQFIGLGASELYNLTIDKDESKNKSIAPDDLPVVNLYNDLVLNGKLTIETGQLINQTYDLTLGQGCDINDGGILDMESPGALYIGAGSSVNVNNGGLFSVEGSELDPVLLTSTNGYFALTVLSGGEISATNAIFEKMSGDGLKVMPGATIDPASALSNCIFRDGEAASALLTILNNQELTIDGAEFYTNGSESYNVKKAVNYGEITFTNFAGDFAGAAHEEDPYNRIHWFEPALSVSPSNQNVSAAAGTVTFNITSNTDWEVSEGFDWLSVSPMSGSGNGMLTVNYDENTSVIDRLASITISADEVPNVTATIIQAGANIILEVDPGNRNVTASAGTTTFNVTSNTSWSVTEGLDWLSVSPANGNGNGTLTVNYDENTTTLSRLGSISILSSGLPNVNVTVTQSGVDVELAVSPANRNVAASAGMTTFNLTSNTAWIISESVGWLTVSPMSGANNKELEVSYDENTSVTPRTGNITISAAGTADVIVTVTQAGVNNELTVSPSNQQVGIMPGTTTFDIMSNTSWNVTESVTWLSTDIQNGTGDAVLNVSYQGNYSTVDRVGEITITTDGKLAVTVTVTQIGITPTLAVDPEALFFLAPNGIGFLNVFSNTNWTISDNMDWLGLNFEIPSGNQMITVSVQMNNTGVVRSGEIVIETEDGSTQIIVPVTQQYFLEHTISLPAGWSGLSSYAIPTPPFIEGIFSGISDELIIALTGEEIYYPEYGINTIAMWEDYSAYKIKTNEAVDLEIYGSSYPDKTMTIASGWSLLPVISECAVDVEDLFASVVADIEIVKDVAGYGLYWPDMGINNLGTLNPGKAYYVLASNPVSISFGDCAKAAISETLTGLSPWEIAKPSTLSHTIAILPQAIQDFEKGSILGAFDLQGNCFGVAALNGKANVLTVFGDDVLTAEKDGFVDGEQIFFKIFNSSTNEEIDLIPEFDFSLPVYDGTYMAHGLSAIKSFKAGSTGTAGLNLEDIRVYPNPSTGTFNVSGLPTGAGISVADIHGQLVFSDQPGANDKFAVDLQHCKPGVYMVKIHHGGNSSFHKMIVK